MSIDKQGGEPENSPPRFPSLPRSRVQTLWYLALAPLVLLPILAVGVVTWGVCLRILIELFNWSYDLFGF